MNKYSYLILSGTRPIVKKKKLYFEFGIKIIWSGCILLPKYKHKSNNFKNYCYRYCPYFTFKRK